MTRLDRFIAFRILATIAVVIFVFYCLIALGESLDSWRLGELAKDRGPEIAALSVLVNAARWAIRTLPVTVLIGAIIALLNLQSRQELMVMKASGLSVWQIVRGPAIGVFAFSIAISAMADTGVTELSRFISPAPQVAGASVGTQNAIWLEQSARGARFIITAARATPDKHGLEDVTVFLGQDFDLRRVIARNAYLQTGLWVFTDALIIGPNNAGQKLDKYFLETDASVADLELKLTSTADLTLFELIKALSTGLTDPSLQSAAATRVAKLLSLPVLLVGTLLIAFAFTAGYRRTGSYGGTILYGIILGFVMFVVGEMAGRAGSAGVLTPALAAWGPASVTVVIGLTVLLYKEDGRA